MKSFKLLMISALAVVTMATAPQSFLKEELAQESNILEAYRTNTAILRGSVSGFIKGLYKQTNYKVSDDCLGENTIEDLKMLQQSLQQSSILSGLVHLEQLEKSVLQNCKVNEVALDLFKWCTTQDCSLDSMINNLLSNVLHLVAVGNELVANIHAMKPEETAYGDLQNFYALIGTNVGQIVRFATSFNAKILNH
eukprot:403346219